jgi:hypothetical protein
MIRNVSVNNIVRLKKLARSSYGWIVVSKTEVFDELMEWLRVEPSITTDFWLLTCTHPKSEMNRRVIFEKPWSASQYFRFTAGMPAKLPERTPHLYAGDEPREPTFRADSCSGRFGVNIPVMLKRVLRSLRLGQRLVRLLVRNVGAFRPKCTYAEYASPTSSRILVCSDSTIEKDHYGETHYSKFGCML